MCLVNLRVLNQYIEDMYGKESIKEEPNMKLIGELKEKVEKTENKEEAKKIIEDAGMELTDEEMDQVAGGPILPMLED